MNKKEIHAYLDEAFEHEYARGDREGYQQGRLDGYRAGRASVVLPHPCDGELYKDWGAADYFAKIAEEHLEVIEAYKEIEKNGGDSQHFLKECTDLIIATTSLMNYLGCDENARQRKMKEVNDDNAKRDGGKRFKNHPLDEIEERLYKRKTFSASSNEAKQNEGANLVKSNLLLPLEIGEKVKIVKPDGYREALSGENIYQRIFDVYMFYHSGDIGRNEGYISSISCCLVKMEDSREKIIVPIRWLKRV